MADVKKIVLDIDGKEIKLDLKQAKELRDILVDLWPEKRAEFVPYYIDRWRDRPWRYNEWIQPYITWSSGKSNPLDNAIYMSTTGGTNV